MHREPLSPEEPRKGGHHKILLDRSLTQAEVTWMIRQRRMAPVPALDASHKIHEETILRCILLTI